MASWASNICFFLESINNRREGGGRWVERVTFLPIPSTKIDFALFHKGMIVTVRLGLPKCIVSQNNITNLKLFIYQVNITTLLWVESELGSQSAKKTKKSFRHLDIISFTHI